MKTSLILLLAVLSLATCYDNNPYYRPIRACGANLARIMQEVCLLQIEQYETVKKSTLAAECCDKECDIGIIQKFCVMSEVFKNK